MEETKNKKHSTKYHLKQLDKIAKTGIVPEPYKKVMKGIKNPQAHIKKVQADLRKIEEGEHKAHIKMGEEFDKLCLVCNPDGKKRTRRKKDG